MSYRDLRNFSEAMRALGYPHGISLETFRSPNIAAVEQCLRWLAARLEPEATLAGSHATTDQRVALITHATAFFLSRANIKLNGRRLYGADGWAARELLKVAGLLRAAQESPAAGEGGAGGAAGGDHAAAADGVALNYDVSGRLGEIKQARQLATEITAQGAFLYDLLAKEPENRERLGRALSRPLSLSGAQEALERALASLAGRVTATRDQGEALAATDAALLAKLERRRAELQRAEKRLRTVHSIKPAYQGELTALESEIEQLWEQYVLRYRCVEALKHQLSMLEDAQAEAAEEQQSAIMQLIHKYEAEDVLGKISDSDELYSSDEKEMSEVKPRPATRPRTRLRIKTAGGDAAESRRAYGTMAGVGTGTGTGTGTGGARDSLDDIRDEDDLTESDMSDRPVFGGRGQRPRPVTRTLNIDDDELIDGMEAGDGGDSLGSSSESELRLTSAAAARPDLLSDNEF